MVPVGYRFFVGQCSIFASSIRQTHTVILPKTPVRTTGYDTHNMMDTKISVFNDKRFGEIRTVTMSDGQIWFVGRDMARALSYSDPRKAIAMHVEEGDKLMRRIVLSGQNRRVTLINESGIYALVLSSRLPLAREFKSWLTNDVLPKLRLTGAYMTRDMMMKMLQQPDQIVNLCQTLIQIDQKREEAERIMHTLVDRVAVLQPKADYCDQVLDSVDCLTSTQVAKGLGMTAIELNRMLCEMGIQYWQSGQYLLYAEYARLGLARNRTHFHKNADGSHTHTYLVWTERGREFITRQVRKTAA